MNPAFDTALAEFQRLRAIEKTVGIGFASIEEEEAHQPEIDAACEVCQAAFDHMIVIPVSDAPRAVAKLLAINDFYELGTGVDGKALAQVLAEIETTVIGRATA